MPLGHRDNGVCVMVVLRKKLRRLFKAMAKNRTKRGHSVRNGNAPSPYKKYEKQPYRYSQDYRDWFNAIVNKTKPKEARKARYQYKEAAE